MANEFVSVAYQITSGDDGLLDLTCKDRDGNVVDVTGFLEFTFTVASLRDGAPGAQKFQKTFSGAEIIVVDAANGVIRVPLDAADTEDLAGTFYCEAKATNAASKKWTGQRGTIEILKNASTT